MSRNNSYSKNNNGRINGRNIGKQKKSYNRKNNYKKSPSISRNGMSSKNRNKKGIKRKKKVSKVRLFIVVFVSLIILFSIYRGFSFIKSKYSGNESKETTKSLSAEEIEKQNANIINIMLDPAKGGNDTGLATKNIALTEKEINLKIAQLIRDDLLKYKDVRVMLTRDYDNEKKISERVKLAKQNEIDIFVSIRLNAQSRGTEANGMDTYYSTPKLKPSLVEKKKLEEEQNSYKSENSSEISEENKKTDISDINSQDKDGKKEERVNLSKKLATSIQETATSFIDFKDRGIVNNEFDVLKYTEMPAVIVHCGFITNKDDEKILENDDKLKDLADGISSGILHFIDHNKNDIIRDRINYR